MGHNTRQAPAPDAPIETYGEAARIVMARGRFAVHELGQDLRVIEHYRKWIERRNLPSLNRQQAATKSIASERLLLAAIWDEPAVVEWDAMARLLDTMGLRFHYNDPYPWAVGKLFDVFQAAAYNDVAARLGRPTRMIEAKLEGLAGLPPGRFPRHEGRDIWRDVSWVYRYFAKSPTDDIAQLTEEYAKSENRVTEAHSVVQNGIDRAISWLGLAMSR